MKQPKLQRLKRFLNDAHDACELATCLLNDSDKNPDYCELRQDITQLKHALFLLVDEVRQIKSE